MSKFEELLEETYKDAHKVWKLIDYICNSNYGPNFSFNMGRNYDGNGYYYAEFGDCRSTSESPVAAICRAANKAMDLRGIKE